MLKNSLTRILIVKKKALENLPPFILQLPTYRRQFRLLHRNQIEVPNPAILKMADQPSTESYIRKNTSKQSSTRSPMLNAYLLFASLCAIIALIVSAISLHRANEALSFKSSTFTTDLERTFNSTAYAIADSGTNDVACSNLTAETVTGQTSMPGQCVTVADSYNLWVTRLAENCTPYVYAEANCTGTNRPIADGNFPITVPQCVVAAGSGELKGDKNSTYNSFQILCT